MRADNRGLLAIVVAFAVVISVGGAVIFLTALPTTLPIQSGTAFYWSDVSTWAAHLDVPGVGSRLVGAWSAFDGRGFPVLMVVNGTVDRPMPSVVHCPLIQSWTEYNGSIDTWVDPGPHTLFWGYCFVASRIVITSTVKLA